MQTLRWSLAVAAVAVTVACGDSKSSLNPTAPSAVVADSQALDAGAAGEGEAGVTANGPKPGRGNGNGNGNGNNGGGNGNGSQPRTPSNQPPSGNTTPGVGSPVPPGRNKVEIEGLIQAVGAASITVNAQMVGVTEDTVIRHGNRRFELSDLHVGDRVHVRANRTTATGSSVVLAEATLEASEILLQNPGDAADDDDSEDPDALVSVMAFDASASEAGPATGAFRLSRAGDPTLLASPLTVSFTLTGTAGNGTDYTLLPLSATFAANQATVDVVVTPIADAVAEAPETVILTLTGVAPYDLGSPVAATVTITDTANPLVSVTAASASATEAGDAGRFLLSRTGSFAAPLTVTLALTGTAQNGVDYQPISTTVTFLAGQASVNVWVLPNMDADVDPSETVILTVVDDLTYDLGASFSATVTISGS